jgi:hypothetical protein
MIKTEIKINKNNKPIITQKVTVVCDNCQKEWIIPLHYQIDGLKKYEKDLCRGCKQREQIKTGVRDKQYINAGIAAKNKMKGKTHIEIFGLKKALEMKQKNSDANSGKNNANYGGLWHGRNPGLDEKGKTYEEIYGIEKATLIKEKIAKHSRGKNNPMYGKPAPIGSGNGWCGWYKNWHFRSLMELSFMINTIERFHFKWKTGESKKYRISYTDYDGKQKNYFPDFILNEKYMIEIKPKHLIDSVTVKQKKESAITFCKNNNLKYKIITPTKRLTFQEIKSLVDNNQIKFINRYQIKYEKWMEKEQNKKS